jgi:putative Mg2+ transporter-C (MgtC) family protein
MESDDKWSGNFCLQPATDVAGGHEIIILASTGKYRWVRERMDDLLHRVWASIAAEFSDISNVEQFTQMAVRLSMAAILGGIIGYEREAKRKSAGLRTHILVGLGSAMFVVVPLQAGVLITDLSRVLQGLVAGIGFLGAGAIVHGDRSNHGLTTAASVWLTAAIGASAGMGREGSAVLGTVLTVIVLSLVRKATASKNQAEPDTREKPTMARPEFIEINRAS